MKRSLPLWEVFVDYGSRSRHHSKLVFAESERAALRKTRHARRARLVNDGLNRRLFPELFE
jgi:hypothetical protein